MEQKRFVNERGAAFTTRKTVPQAARTYAVRAFKQPQAGPRHRATHMSFSRAALTAVIAAFCVAAAAQAAAPGNTAPAAGGAAPLSASVRPALSQVAQTLNSVSPRRWKAPQPVRDEADEDITSIQRDLNGTLAGLLQQADAAPGSVPVAFAVYRNIDALYDTLLRVVETAELAAPENEEAQLESALKSLEGARGSLGDTILSGAQSQQTELLRLRTAIATATVAQRAPVKTVVVNDGPASSTTTHHKHTTTTKKKPATSTGSSSSPASGSSTPAAKPNAGTPSPQ
jgi:hypothetical protein